MIEDIENRLRKDYPFGSFQRAFFGRWGRLYSNVRCRVAGYDGPFVGIVVLEGECKGIMLYVMPCCLSS